MKTFRCAALVLSLTSCIASAQMVEDRKAVLDAQIELSRKEKELQDLRRSLAGTAALGMPVVVSVTVGAQRLARLQLPNGIVGHYREGEMVRPGMVVTSIAPKQVFVTVSGGRRAAAIPLEFAGPVIPGAPQMAQQQQNVPDSLLPPVPEVQVPAIEVIPAAKAAPPAEQAPASGKAGK